MNIWQDRARHMLNTEREMIPLHSPPSTGCLAEWRREVKVGCVQWPVSELYPAIVFLSITSKYVDPQFIRAIRELDPGRLELLVDDALQLDVGNFHIVRREGRAITILTPEETQYIAAHMPQTVIVQPLGRPV